MIIDISEKIVEIKKNAAECVGDNFDSTLSAIFGERPPIVYWGTATTGVPHYGYFIPLLKIIDLMRCGCHVKILIADVHSMLDAQKSSYEQSKTRALFYSKLIVVLIKTLTDAMGLPGVQIVDRTDLSASSPSAHDLSSLSTGASPNYLEIVLGSSFQLSPKYSLDKLRLEGIVRIQRARRASAEVVKQQEDPEIGALTYPLMQALDEEYLGVDMQMGGLDQRKILMLAREVLPLLGYKKRLHLMTPMLPGLLGGLEKKQGEGQVGESEKSGFENKMSSSDRNGKIDFFDSKGAIRKKIRKSFAVERDPSNTPILETVRLIVLPIFGEFRVNRKEEYGGDKTYRGFESLKKDYEEGKLHPMDLKNGVVESLNRLIEGVREEITNGSLKDSFKAGYPELAKEVLK